MPNIHNKEAKKRELHKRQGGRCAICQQGLSLRGEGPEAPTFDHIIPRSKQGPTTMWNLRLTHQRCNNSRGDETDSIMVEVGGVRVLRHDALR